MREWKKILAWVAFHSDQVARAEDVKGCNILQHAILFRAPADVVDFLLWAAPELASVANKDGEVALHWAVRLSTSGPVMNLLLKAYPEGAFMTDVNGSSPLSLLWERRQILLLQIWRTERQRLLDETECIWKRIMSVYHALQEDENMEFRPLHLAAAHPTPPCLFPLMLQVYKEQIAERDDQGRLALSIACEFPLANRSCDVLTKIQMMLREAPDLARIADPNSGQYPLLLAVSAGILWSDGVESLIQAFPVALTFRDPVTKLFPFALAALPKSTTIPESAITPHRDKTCLEVDTIYNTLRSDPSVLRLCGF